MVGMETHFETIHTKDTSLPEQTAEQISKLIVEQRLTSKDKLPSEFELAELLHVGRGTVREGVKLLVARNVLEIRRGKGTSHRIREKSPIPWALPITRISCALRWTWWKSADRWSRGWPERRRNGRTAKV